MKPLVTSVMLWGDAAFSEVHILVVEILLGFVENV